MIRVHRYFFGICAIVCASLVTGDASAGHRAAIETLKAELEAHPENGEQARALARIYLDMGNRTWAVRTLLTHLEHAPDDVETRAWAAWFLMQDGDLYRAGRMLHTEPPPEGPERDRWALMRAEVEALGGDMEAAQDHLRVITNRGPKLYVEDLRLYRKVRLDVLGDPSAPVSARLLARGGWSSDVPLAEVDLALRIEPWLPGSVRPVGEVDVHGLMPLGESTGWLDMVGQAGLAAGDPGGIHGRLLYSYDLVGTQAADAFSEGKGYLYAEAHRGDVILDPIPGLQVLAGGGRRLFREMGRTRTEIDLGAILEQARSTGWTFDEALLLNTHLATGEDWDSKGFTAIGRAAAPLPWGALAVATASLGMDFFDQSGIHSFTLGDGVDPFGGRRETLLRGQIGPWSPDWRRWRLGLEYDFTHASNSATDDGGQTEHRAMLQLRWAGSANPLAPLPARAPKGHDRLPYQLPLPTDSGLDSVRDFLRLNNGARSGGSCLE